MYFKASVRKKSEREEFKSSVVTGSLKVTYQPIGIDSKFDTCSRPVGREQALTACFGDGGGAWTYNNLNITDAQGNPHKSVTFFIRNGAVVDIKLQTLPPR